jgi:hypothetical protein
VKVNLQQSHIGSYWGSFRPRFLSIFSGTVSRFTISLDKDAQK